MHVKIQKWGNSLAIRIPKSLARQINVQNNSFIDLTIEGGKLIVEPVNEEEYSLEQLLAGITAGNIHDEIETGVSEGKEAW